MASRRGLLSLPAVSTAAVLLMCGMLYAQPPDQNLALNRPYRCSVPIMTGWTGLTDGAHDSDSAPECFATANVEVYPKYVTIDLGAVATIQRVVVHNSANGNTRKVSIECSVDGQQFQALRAGFIFQDRTAQTLSHQFEARQARYVRVTFHDTWGKGLGGDHTMFLREVEVFGDAPDILVPDAGENPLGPYLGQSAGLSYPSVPIFRRYCLGGPADTVRIAVLGDSFAVADGDQKHWSAQLAGLLDERYAKQVSVQPAAAAAFSPLECRRFVEQAGDSAPDLVLLSVGHEAALGRQPMAEFRSSAEQMIRTLAGGTEALVVLVTPMPMNPNPELRRHEVAAGVDTRLYAWQLELLAQQYTVPLLRTGAALAGGSTEHADLYADALSLSEQGHQALAAALDRLLAGQ